uniref:Uncharacterized protein n=1 Tax=Caudovirales sp. ctu3532 TaxID=2827639 RepID=A0A8S5TJ00_9CAUD|nr:MAG TPA: hypothetical protein [Caudovirales sp. ctu3532]
MECALLLPKNCADARRYPLRAEVGRVGRAARQQKRRRGEKRLAGISRPETEHQTTNIKKAEAKESNG